MKSVLAWIRENHKNNIEEYEVAIPIATPLVVILWPAFGYLWSSFGLFESLGIRYMFALLYALVALPLMFGTQRKMSRTLHALWVTLNAFGVGVFPWCMYMYTDRSAVWLLSMMFFAVTFGVAVRGIDMLPALAITSVSVVLMFSETFDKQDAYVAIIQMSMLLMTALGLSIIRLHRLKERRVQKELTQANALLLKNEHSKDEFMARVAHELRNPLSVIISYVWDIMDDVSVPDNVRDRVCNINEAAKRVDQMIRELQDLQRFTLGLAQLNRSTVDLVAYAAYLRNAMLGVASTYGVKLLVVSKAATAVFDKERMDHIAFNLIDNAIKYRSSKDAMIDVIFEAHGTTLVLLVSDNGVGISEDQIPLVFRRYYQIDAKSTNGMGIGLSLVHEVAKAHVGEVVITSEVGVGTTVKVTIPNAIIP